MAESVPAAGGGDPSYRPWAVAWQEALYGPGGFYRLADGPRAHFETSANAGGGAVQVFAEALLALAARHGCTRIVDVGAGRGELLTAIGSAGDVALVGVDVVRRPDGLPDRVRWLTAPGGAALPPELVDLDDALVIAHEWLDVVPCPVLEVDADGRPRVVEVDAAGHERLGREPDPDDLTWCARWWPVEGAEPGARVEVGLARDRAWAGLLGRVHSGLVLAVDYGHRRDDRPPRGTLAAHRAGRLVPPVPDGSCDLTADVAWDSLVDAGATVRQPTVGSDAALPQCASQPRLVTQREALIELGVDAGRPAPGGDPAAYLLDLQRASAAATLLDPGGLGGLHWLVHVFDRADATGHAATPPARLDA